MEIKVIGIGPDMQEEAKNLQKAFEKMLGVETDKPSAEADKPSPEAHPEDALIELLKRSLNGGVPSIDEFKQAKKRIKKAVTNMQNDGLGIDVAAMAMSEVTCIMFSGVLTPKEGKTSKEAFMDYIGTVFDAVDKQVKELRAKREAEKCNGR